MNSAEKVMKIIAGAFVTVVLVVGGALFVAISTGGGPNPLVSTGVPLGIIGVLALMWWGLLRSAPAQGISNTQRYSSVVLLIVCMAIFLWLYFYKL
ncbi:MAG: hypothetical protein WA021_02150 [Minisyncoccia bacterium]